MTLLAQALNLASVRFDASLCGPPIWHPLTVTARNKPAPGRVNFSVNYPQSLRRRAPTLATAIREGKPMTVTALGTWRRPPLVYVVAELVISPYYSMAAKVPGLQDRMRSAFPRTREAQELVIDGAKPSAQPVWQLTSVDQKHGVQFGTRSISLHATSYVQSSDFLGRWAEVLDAIQEAGLGAFVERAGLRYVDLIVPAEGRSPSDYLAPGLQGITPEGGQPTGSMWATAFQFDGSLVNLRAAAPTPQGLLLPPEFNALPLNKPTVMLEAEKLLKAEQPIGFVDTDCLRDIAKVFDAGELIGAYTEMQKLTSKTFKAALSDLAKGEWM